MQQYSPDIWYASKRLWASVLAIVALVFSLVGIKISDIEQQQLLDAIMAFIPAAAALVAAILALVSKINEKKKLGLFCLLLFAGIALQGCITPVGMYLGATKVTCGSTDIEMKAEGNDKLDVQVAVNPGAATYGGNVGLSAQGVKSVVSKGNVYMSETAGRAKGVNAVFLGKYSRGEIDGNPDSANYSTNFTVTEGGGILHDLVRGWGVREENASVPEYNFSDAASSAAAVPEAQQ